MCVCVCYVSVRVFFMCVYVCVYIQANTHANSVFHALASNIFPKIMGAGFFLPLYACT